MGKQKKLLLLFLYWLVMISLIGCKKEKEQSIALDSLAENGIKKADVLKGCEIISNPLDYTSVREDQSYHFETDDSHFAMTSSLVDAGTSMFYLKTSYLHYYNKETNKCGLLCSKPECTHSMGDSNSCNASVPGYVGLAYASGSLYTVDINKINLVKIALDGAERTIVGELCTVPEEEVTERNEGSFSIEWIIHRGYIYYYYTLYSGTTEDIYYLNGSNCLYRMPIDGSSGPECIMPFICEGHSEYTILKGYGSYVYMNIAEKGKNGGYLYRYNIESNKIEKLEALGNDIRGYTVKNKNIYYSYFNEPEKIYCYDESSGISQLLFTVEEDENHICISWIYSDEENIYIKYSEENITKGMFMFDWYGNMISDISLINSENGNFCGVSDECLYFLKMKDGENPWIQTRDFYTIPYYIEKTDLADGAYEIHEAEN